MIKESPILIEQELKVAVYDATFSQRLSSLIKKIRYK